MSKIERLALTDDLKRHFARHLRNPYLVLCQNVLDDMWGNILSFSLSWGQQGLPLISPLEMNLLLHV
jgi:hypothetical protein